MLESEKIGQPSQDKEYWDTGIKAHTWTGMEKSKQERLESYANKIHFLFEKQILPKYKSKEQGGNDYELELYDQIGKNEQGFKTETKYNKVNTYIKFFDELQYLLNNKIENLPYDSIEDLVNGLKNMENTNLDDSAKLEINKKLRSLDNTYFENSGYRKAA